jgi:hypothetical protein
MAGRLPEQNLNNKPTKNEAPQNTCPADAKGGTPRSKPPADENPLSNKNGRGGSPEPPLAIEVNRRYQNPSEQPAEQNPQK